MEKMESRLLKGLNDYNHMDEYYSMLSEPLMFHLTFLQEANEFHTCFHFWQGFIGAWILKQALVHKRIPAGYFGWK
ncbi:MAG: hypothetical protein IPJ66_10235 [Bacteroidetes bacterium]|nr:hypothetical protein [Bacteroidota bacterium]